jgi:hypothetical protein
MKTEIEITAAAVQMLRPNPTPAPSLRVPVTIHNRAMLRRLRAAEMFAWEAADRKARQRMIAPAFAQQSCVA